MAGHSHFANIAHKKALVDKKRGKLWTKLARYIMVAARLGGGDPETNPRLRLAVADAKAARMPKDTIERNIKKGTGELAGENLEEVLYEGYGPGGVAVLVDVLTDNRNRAAGEVRNLFELHGGKLGVSGSVGWLFERKGLLLIPAEKAAEDSLMELALEAGAEDVRRQGDKFEVLTPPENYSAVSEALAHAGIEPELKQLTRIPANTIDLDAESGRQMLHLLAALDDLDDVQHVVANFNLPDDVMTALAAEQALQP